MPDEPVGPLELEGKRVVLLLQGGGALGAYQVGAYRALETACRHAKTQVAWVGGISIGAINAAVIAGPTSGDAGADLERLWNDIISPPFPPFDASAVWQSLPPAFRSGWLAPLAPKYANWIWEALGPFGQRHLFSSRVLDPLRNPWTAQWTGPLSPKGLAFYDTEPLRKTLNRHVNWDAINANVGRRLSLGATRVTDGETVFFNSFESKNSDWGRQRIRVDHVLASGALPPAFPAIEIDDVLYWDGGVSTNTPIEALAEDITAEPARDTIVFLIDVWDRKGAVPRSLDELLWRQKSIAYGSRKNAAVSVVNTHELEVEAKRVPPTRLEVCQVMLEQPPGEAQPQFGFADADFSRMTYDRLAKQGSHDMLRAIERPLLVRGVGGEYAVLYRLGTHAKNTETDKSYNRLRERQDHAMRAFEESAHITHA